MMRSDRIVLLFAFLRTSHALDWGKMDQYNSDFEHPSQLEGTAIWISAKDDEAFDVALSQDTQAKVEGVLEGCGTTDDRCFQDVLNTIHSADVHLDEKIERRHIGHMISKAAKGSWSIFADIALMLTLNWEQKADKMDNSAFRLPVNKVEEAATSFVHSAGGSAAITITPTVAPTQMTGSVIPAITTMPSDGNGHKKGDIIAKLDVELARRINEIAHRMMNCEDGRKFDSEHKLRRRDDPITYGQALCAAEGIIGMTGTGSAFSDLAKISFDNMRFEFAQNAKLAKDALPILRDFILALGPALAIPEKLVDQLTVYVLAIVIDALVLEKVPISPENFLGPDIVVLVGSRTATLTPTSTSTTASATSGCPDPTQTPLYCGRDEGHCDGKIPDKLDVLNKHKGIVCKNSIWKGCPCNAPVIEHDTFINPQEHTAMRDAYNILAKLKDLPAIRSANIVCRNHPLSAPRFDADSHDESSVERAVNDWCRDNDGKELSGSESIYWRWGITQHSVPNRSSFWLRATKTCETSDKFNRWECKKALLDGMSQCDDGPQTHGLAASVGCIDYSIDLSGITYDMPPWAEYDEGRHFPPPEFAKKKDGDQAHAPECHPEDGVRKPLTEEQLSYNIDQVCGAVKDFPLDGNLVDVYWQLPLAKYRTPEWADDDGKARGFQTILHKKYDGQPDPYQDMEWCK
ncbi:hypothetical protein P154DRAFT_611177 [Amniculicola lignicola CBS 123094]|uniref:Uncharacterized protein n=1 Tax=Amniculicola lignicola CBS 123094 TaxID=1392246 RepID=A0A6A5W273_9PLEO|nr:hypothetical protein P154DRAFT_611177 [Amniculicola lignicola CBS 123094]